MMLIEINIYLCMIKVYTFITCLHQLHLLIILLLLLFKRVMENVISCQWINKRIVIVIVIVYSPVTDTSSYFFYFISGISDPPEVGR